MGISKFLLLFSIVALISTGIALGESPESTASDEPTGAVADSDESVQVEVSQLKSTISQLESKIDEKALELTRRDKTVEELEKILGEKSNTLASFESRIQSLEENLFLNTKEQAGNAQERASRLHEQIISLNKEIEAQNEKKVALEARAKIADSKIQDLNVKLEDLQRTRDEQKSRIHKTQRALEVAEEELMKAKLEASSISKKLNEVHEAWIPQWLAIHFDNFQFFVTTNWEKHGRPFLDVTIKKATDKKTELECWAKPHVDTLKSKWIPLIKESAIAFWNDFGLLVQSLTSTVIDKYHVHIKPHYVTLQEAMDPHIQEAKKLVKPYADQVSAMSKPHLEKARVYLKPYTKKVLRNYKNFSKKFSLYHHQLQATIRDLLKSHELTRPFATKVFVWYTALAIMALPVIFVLNTVSEMFSKKPKRRRRTSHSSQTRRKAKRVHHER